MSHFKVSSLCIIQLCIVDKAISMVTLFSFLLGAGFEFSFTLRFKTFLLQGKGRWLCARYGTVSSVGEKAGICCAF